ncbi:MAG TPA: translation initiation factor IF-2 [Cytophagales bacterium]|nr:translation initiation factor IF-2 [Cytophagales bacterium]
MSETKAPKIRLYKYAAEINLSSENLIEFLKTKGHEVKSHQSILSEDMINEINAHFKKDIEKAEQHYKKIAEFNKKRADKVDKDIKIEEEVPAEVEEKEIVITDVTVEAEIETEVEPEIQEEAKVEETTEVEIPVVEEVVAVEPVEEVKPVVAKVPEKFISPKDSEANKKRGLKVVGKIDLGEDKKQKQAVKKVTPAGTQEKPGTTESTSDAVKKKKRPKTKKKTTTGEAPVEEPTTVKKKKRVKKFEIDEKDVKAAIKQTMLSMDDTVTTNRAASRKKKRREREAEEERLQELKTLDSKVIRVNEFIAVSELANLMEVPVGDVISKCIGLGLMVSINQRLDVENITLVADEFGFEVEFQKEYTAEVLEDIEDDEEDLQPRPPVVTIMGHVDHGKTSLLDYIRKTKVVASEAGGITQHIGAYDVTTSSGQKIAFLDTPGHEAFTAMRARGAKLTDIAIIVVAADDDVMPQTKEAINHAQVAGVPLVFAINKIDKPGANPEKVKESLSKMNILVEDWGGKYQCQAISAKTGVGIDELLEKVLLEAEILNLKANPNKSAVGSIIEAELDKGRGYVSTLMVQAGTLKVGDIMVAGSNHGRVKAMFDDTGNKVSEAGPSTPVQVLGLDGAPQAGEKFQVFETDREAREVANKRSQILREQNIRTKKHITLDEIGRRLAIGSFKQLNVIVKGDVDGSVEALSDSLLKLSTPKVAVSIIHKAVGQISESDVLLASASDAIILGFQVRPSASARKLADTEEIEIRHYSIIYDAINDVKAAMEGMLDKEMEEVIVGNAEVRNIFKISKVGTIAGCMVTDGLVKRSNAIRLIRDGIVVYSGKLGSLKRMKDDASEVRSGFDCGIGIDGFNDINVGDVIESYEMREVKKSL